MTEPIPEYDHEYTMGEEVECRDGLPDDVIPLAENDTHVKIGLIDELPSDTVHIQKEVLRERTWESVEDFRDDVDWDAYSDTDN